MGNLYHSAPINTEMCDELYTTDWASSFHLAKYLCSMLADSFYLKDVLKSE
jgi:hypothetical protein